MTSRRTHARTFIFLAACLTARYADASTISFSSSAAACGDVFHCTASTGPVFAANSSTFTTADGTLSGSAVADIAAGHLGAVAESTYNASVTADAFMEILLGLGGNVPVLTFRMEFAGAFANGGFADFSLIDTAPGGLGGLFGVTCRPTFPAGCIGGDNFSAVAGNPLAFNLTIPVAGVDLLDLTFLLQATTGHGGTSLNPAKSDVLNSLDFTIIVPDGTVIANNPGGGLFQTETPTAPGTVPEPATLTLLATGLVVACRGRRARRTV
jgi:hypothetical protein